MKIIKGKDGIPIQILTKATHMDTKQDMIVYQELKEPFEIYVIDAEHFKDFLNKESMNLTADQPVVDYFAKSDDNNIKIQNRASLIERFLDADSYHEKIRVLESEADFLSEDILELLAASLEETISGKTFEERLDSLTKILQTKARFEFER